MSSFYGGRRGSSFEITAQFDTVSALDTTKVDYGAYCFVKANNTVYRRTTDGFEEVFTLSLPTGSSSVVSLDKYSTVAALDGASIYNLPLTNNERNSDGTFTYAQKINTATGENKIGIKIPYQDLSFTSNSNSLIITENITNPFKKSYTFSLSSSTVSELTGFRSYIVNGSWDIYDPNTDTIMTDLVNGTRILIYQKTSGAETKWYYFGEYNGIKDISFNNGVITIEDYNNSSQSYTIQDIKAITLKDSILTFTYRDDSYSEFNLVYPTSLSYDEDSAIIKVTDSQGNESDLSPEINYIERLIVTEDYHLIAYFSSPTYRDTYKNYTYEDDDEWIDFGTIKQDSGLFIGKHISREELIVTLMTSDLTVEQVIQYLNAVYPNGATGDDKGKVLTVGDNDINNWFFGFNYDKKDDAYLGWYYLGTFSNETDNLIAIMEEDNDDIITTIDSLPVGGIWFVIE